MPDWFKHKYHNYHDGFYKSENIITYGTIGDNPTNKFEKSAQVNDKYYSDNYDLGKGTAKASTSTVGYQGEFIILGFIPKNNIVNKDTQLQDPYFKYGKTNHTINYKVRLPRFQGYIPTNPNNIKGNLRPFCLSTEKETFN